MKYFAKKTFDTTRAYFANSGKTRQHAYDRLKEHSEENMGIDGQVIDGILYVALTGELDEHTCSLIRFKFDSLLETKQFSSVVVDLTQVTFMDSSGIGLIISRFKKMKLRNVPFMLSNPNRTVDKIFRVSGIYRLIPLVG